MGKTASAGRLSGQCGQALLMVFRCISKQVSKPLQKKLNSCQKNEDSHCLEEQLHILNCLLFFVMLLCDPQQTHVY